MKTTTGPTAVGGATTPDHTGQAGNAPRANRRLMTEQPPARHGGRYSRGAAGFSNRPTPKGRNPLFEIPVKIKKMKSKSSPVDEQELEAVTVECICPKCGARHTMNFYWTGRGTPRKFCPRCKK
jgi:hypothetical protein